MHEGNYWQYLAYTYEWWPYPLSHHLYYSIEIKGDTLLGNGQKYKILEKIHFDSLHNNYLFFERIDSLLGNVYQFYSYAPGGEYLLDSLRSLVGDTSKASRSMFGISYQGSYCDSIFDEDFLNTLTTTKRIRQRLLLHTEYHHLSYGFGITYQFANFDFGYTTTNLLYARINGIEYGQPVILTFVENPNIIKSVTLYSNYPNPFNSETTISFDLNTPQKIELSIFSIDGRLIEKLLSKNLSSDNHQFKWNGKNLSSGIYIYQLKTDTQTYNKKCILIK